MISRKNKTAREAQGESPSERRRAVLSNTMLWTSISSAEDGYVRIPWEANILSNKKSKPCVPKAPSTGLLVSNG